MNTDLLNSAALRLLEQGGLRPGDTVCAIQSRSGRVYTGISRMNLHAEIDAIRNMQGAGEVIIDGILLLSAQNGLPMLPCNNCIGYILSLHPENAGCCAILQDRIVRLSETMIFAPPQGGMPGDTGVFAGAPQFSQNNEYRMANTENATSDILKSRVNSLIGDLEDDDEEDEDEKKPRKGLFGFFRK